ncbi:MAG: HAD-IA family hydrolase [Chloroflexi bacterium]|nr:HAD-IA family hydrolase [Chloroflexota bacterium]MDA1009882.1 HAD-IA family hydrolase [Chloroflexota bacterium]
MRITHVIWDLDGTLLNTEPLYARVTDDIFTRFGMRLTEEVRQLMMGRPTPVAVPLMLEHTGLPMTADEFIDARDSELHRLFRDVEAMPGAERLTRHLHAHRIPQAIATSSSRASFEAKQTRHREWFNVFDAIVLGEEVPESKPAPDIFIEAARRLGAVPATCLVFEDAAAGIAAALAAGMHVIGVPERGHEERVQGAHAIIDGLAAFDPEEWGLPAYGPPAG